MRLICTFENQKQGYQLSSFLTHQGIENQLEVISNTEWDSPEYGNVISKIWVYDEDQADQALRLADDFVQNPNDPRFQTPLSPIQLPLVETPLQQKTLETDTEETPVSAAKTQGLGTITTSILFLCIILFIISSFTEPSIVPLAKGIPYFPVFTSQIYKDLLYDYPYSYELIDRIVKAYGIESLQNLNTLPSAGQYLLQQFQETQYWHGFYPKIVEHFKDPGHPWIFDTPLFEKIHAGEWWRLFTPCLLHNDIFHLFFNMIWMVILGKQIEQRIGMKRYILFIILTAIISNTAQYLMSGFEFLGYSGVVAGMLGFIWVRQKRAGWEGYNLNRGTLTFIAFFILFLLGLQILSFLIEIFANKTMPIGIANTAHLVGAFIGIILARLKFFAWTHR